MRQELLAILGWFGVWNLYTGLALGASWWVLLGATAFAEAAVAVGYLCASPRRLWPLWVGGLLAHGMPLLYGEIP